MKQILIDTNVILDFALQRQNFGETAKNLIALLFKNNIQPYVTASSITDIYYVLTKSKGHINSIGFLRSFFELAEIAGVSKESILNALHSNMADFEDAVQTETAKQNDINVIITRNKKDFINSGIKVFSPDEFINLIINQ